MADCFAKYSCTYCQENVTGIIIKCDQCHNFNLCLQCFAAGAEIGPHKKDHSYKFFDSGAITISLVQNGWSAREQIQLLDSIEKFGFGNWEDISKTIETKSPDEAKEEYISRFIEGSIGRLTWPSAASCRPDITDKTQTNQNEPPIEPVKLAPLDVRKEEAALLGYMPQRDDFEREHDYSAESLVSSLFLNNPDDQLDVAFKLAQVDMYIRKLRERARRKRVTNDYQLVSLFFASLRKDKSLKKKSKEERDFYDRMRVFTQFHTAHEHEQFLQNLIREQELRLRCTELAKYRLNGITKLEECFHFEQLRHKQDDCKDKRSDNIGSVHLLRSAALKKRGKGLESCASPGKRFPPRHHPVQQCTTSNSSLDAGSSSSSEGVEAEDEPLTQPEPLEKQHAYQLLSPSEIKLCTSFNLSPSHFLTLKTVLISDHQIKDIINSQDDFDDSDETSLNESEKQIINYFENSGWLITS